MAVVMAVVVVVAVVVVRVQTGARPAQSPRTPLKGPPQRRRRPRRRHGVMHWQRRGRLSGLRHLWRPGMHWPPPQVGNDDVDLRY